VTFPDPYAPGAGQEAIQPPPNQGYNPPPADLSYNQANQGHNPPPSPGFTPAPPVPAAYGYGQYPANAVPQGMYFDPVSGLALPEGTQLANVGRRIGAWFLTFPLIVVTLGLGYIVWGLIVWGNGQTPALQVLGMRCWRPETNRVPGFWFMALREIPGRIIDHFLNFITLITSFVLFLAGKEHRALHDYLAGTVVLYDPNKVLAS
jgi:uncharacterized RDD family membrane protein YckC